MSAQANAKHDLPVYPAATAPQGADEAVGVPESHWYVAIVAPRHEKAVADKLLKINVQSYAATQRERHRWANGRCRWIDRVVIGSMVFVRCTEAERREVVKLPYILRFLTDRASGREGLNKPVAVIPDREMQRLMFMLGNADTPVDFTPASFKAGDPVHVVRGPLRGLEGEITENSDGTHILSVSLAVLGGARVRINPADVEPV